jgi:hypothetical protein
MRRLPSIHAGGAGSGSGSGRYSSSGSKIMACVRGCSGIPNENFHSLLNYLFYHTRQTVLASPKLLTGRCSRPLQEGGFRFNLNPTIVRAALSLVGAGPCPSRRQLQQNVPASTRVFLLFVLSSVSLWQILPRIFRKHSQTNSVYLSSTASKEDPCKLCGKTSASPSACS